LNNANFAAYDIVSVRPVNEKVFQTACLQMDVDIVSVDLSVRLPFRLKHSTVGAAVDRGVFFEISFGQCFRGKCIFVCVHSLLC
jgi:ribonuclease P/MRP protein subunit RPP1